MADEVEDRDAQALPKVNQARSREGGSKEKGGPFIRLKDIYALWNFKVISQQFKRLAPHHDSIPDVLFDMAGAHVVARPQTVALKVVRGRTETGWRSQEVSPPFAPHMPRIITVSRCVALPAQIMCASSNNSHSRLHECLWFLSPFPARRHQFPRQAWRARGSGALALLANHTEDPWPGGI